MGGYIDFYYCFNYVDLEKEMNRDASGDIGIDTSAMQQQSKKNDADRIVPLRLTTDDGQASTSLFATNVEKINDSTRKSLKEGYATVTKFYDRIKKQFLVFTVDSTTSDGDRSIILKGAEKDEKYKNENVKRYQMKLRIFFLCILKLLLFPKNRQIIVKKSFLFLYKNPFSLSTFYLFAFVVDWLAVALFF